MELVKKYPPHISSENTTSKVMSHVIISLLPTLAVGGMIFGGRALMLTGFCVLTAMLWELICGLITKRGNTTDDLSAAVSGMIFAMTLSSATPFWIAGLGTLMSVVVFKQLFGGLGKNILNPAMASRLCLGLIFPKQMNVYLMPFTNYYEFTTAPTPLETGDAEYFDLLMGSVAGAIGEVSKIALFAGAVYLVAMKVIDGFAPLMYMLTVFVLSTAIGKDGLYDLLAGGVVFAAIYMASDYTTTPLTGFGKVIFGMFCGAITCAIRYFTPIGNEVAIAILVMNLAAPLIDRVTEKK
ncbi:MAG: RnfABCDGE type electron transport complex subunit D [Ruminococcus sp.]|nr:RnfABCDGE type electron transport complex subunit D [Ruminococcus sp.]